MKIKSVYITITIIFIGIIAAIYVNKPKFIEENIESAIINKELGIVDESRESVMPDKDITFAVLGDVHENVDSFNDAIKDLNTINPYMDALVLNGDTVDQGIDEQYDSIKKIISDNRELLPKTIIKNIGNHEFYNYKIRTNSPDQVQTFIKRYLEFSGEEKVYHDTWINNYHFISLGSEDGNSTTIDSVRAFISKDQQKWLKEKLAEKYQRGKPIFVFLHQHLNSSDEGWIGVEQSKQVREILSKYPEVILFTSHTHSDLNESSVTLNQPFTMVHTGAVTYTIIPDEKSDKGIRREPYIKGIYIEVNGNKVVIKGRDIKEKQWIFTKEIFC
ncbi:metallophosphoesterase [Clostridium sp.]|uniref:metallophosphoesterase family protein n=1 Tax=Clostridium sp. TaxID=1506 RepID=UPI00284C1ABD|nr:metallophosphoesterase [Clostridium sp.]MDR3597768.1 metallophosphoesterase [Clostridium sp.]